MKNSPKFCSFCLVLLGILLSGSALTAQQCLQGWTYRVAVNIDNSGSDVSLTNYQVSLILNTRELIASGKLNYDGSDLRILSASGSVLPFWTEKTTFNTTQTKIWVKVPALQANAGETIYLFYGRAQAQDISSGENTFEFFDDFDDVTINTSKWNSCNGGEFLVSNDYATITSTTSSAEKATLMSQKTFSVPVVSEMFVNSVSGTGGSFIGLADPVSKNGYGLFYQDNGGTTMRMKLFGADPACFMAKNEEPSVNSVSALSTQGVWRLSWPAAGSQQIDWPGAPNHPLSRTDATYTMPATTALTIGNMDLEGSVQIDWVRVRKYAEAEPVTSLGEEVASVTSAVANNNGPLCEGQTLQLTAEAVSGADYLWSGPGGFTSGLQNPEISNVTAAHTGTYQVEVSIPEGCSSVKTTTDVMVSSATVAGSISGAAVVCAGNNSGTITLSGYNGQVKRWEFSNSGADPWGSINNTSPELPYTNLVTTTYFRAVVQNGACEEKISNVVMMDVNPATKGGKAIGSASACSEDNSGLILLSGHVGQVINWESSTDNWLSITETENTTESLEYANLSKTTQFRAVVQSGVCEAVYSEPATITIHALPEVSFTATAVCDGYPVTFQNNSLISSGSIVSYLWDFGDGTSSIESEPSKQYLNNGTYMVKLTAVSDKGCRAQATEKVTIYEFPVADFTLEDVCYGEPVVVSNSSFYSAGGLSFHWDFGDGTKSDQNAPSHLYKEPGVYPVKLLVESGLGCKDSLTRYVEIFQLPEADAGRDTTISKGYPARLMAQGGVVYAWEPVYGLNNSNIASPVATPLETTTYTLTVTDARGCSSTDEVTVFVENDFRLQVSNVLTPDGNGQNDTWMIKNIENLGENQVYVFDRQGRQVFSQKGYKNDWNGYKGTDLLPDGTYYYLISFSGSDKQYKGAITILRNQN